MQKFKVKMIHCIRGLFNWSHGNTQSLIKKQNKLLFLGGGVSFILAFKIYDH